jgi:hypothetical protein
MPDALAERVMNALKADPRTVDLRALAPHFYTLSERILEIFEEEEMVDVLIDVSSISRSYPKITRFTDHQIQTFKKRAAEISDHAHNPRGAVGEGVDFLRGLDESERQCKWLEHILWWMAMMTDNSQYSARPMIEQSRCGSGLEKRRRNDHGVRRTMYEVLAMCQ